MATPLSRIYFTEEEYLDIEREAEERHEYIDGRIYAMAGESEDHDVLVVCGERRFHDKFRDVLINPNVIIEVLSESAEPFDRGEKFIRYRTWLPSLADYLSFPRTPLSSSITAVNRAANGCSRRFPGWKRR
jgi:Uma2 family endonuclease